MLVILDTNVLLSALLCSDGTLARLLDAWEHRLFTLVCCDEIIAELREVATRAFFKRRLSSGSATSLAVELRTFSVCFADLPSGPIAPDPRDSFLLALAETSQANFLVTGDKELLALKRHRSTRIIAPAGMFELLKKAEP